MTTRFLILVTAVLAALLAPDPCRAAEPRASFTVDAGWVNFRLTRDGEPISDARIKVLDARGEQFATGETGKDGDGSFPLPTGPCCIVEFEVGGKTADPIRLTPRDGGVFPREVLLSFGLAPCCRAPSRGGALYGEPTPDAPGDAMPRWLLVAGISGVVFFTSVIGGLIWSARREQNPSTTRASRD